MRQQAKLIQSGEKNVLDKGKVGSLASSEGERKEQEWKEKD